MTSANKWPRSEFLAADWYVSHDFSSGAFDTVNRQGTTNLFGALPHANQPKMTSPAIACQLIVKPLPIVLDAEPHSTGIEYQIDKDSLRVRVSHGIVHSLLSDA